MTIDKQKFMFDRNSFEDPNKKEPETPPELTFTETEVEEIKKTSFASGKASGVEESSKSQEDSLIKLMEHMKNLIGDMIAEADKREEEKNNAIIHVSLKMVQKLFPNLLGEVALEEVNHMVVEALSLRQEEPRVVITVHDSMLDSLKERIDAISEKSGFQGKIILMAGDVSQSDCRVEWADGGAERSFEKTFMAIENALSKQLSHKLQEPET